MVDGRNPGLVDSLLLLNEHSTVHLYIHVGQYHVEYRANCNHCLSNLHKPTHIHNAKEVGCSGK